VGGEQGVVIEGDSWEIYGDWSDDPGELTTRQLYRLP
jgi:hypothetical protein